MSEYWKSTPSYWCKFCSRYVRDTGIERRNHEASAQHQNNIQRSLRDLHKNREREEREQQRAKDEVARLRGEKPPPRPSNNAAPAPGSGPVLSPAQQRKAHAEQLAALGVALPDDLKQEVTGVGEFKVVNEVAVVAEEDRSTVTVSRSLADILAEEREAEKSGDSNRLAGNKRKVEAEDEDGDEHEFGTGESRAKRRTAWGSSFKSYPGKHQDDDDNGEDLDAILNGIGAVKKEAQVKVEGDVKVKTENEDEGAQHDATTVKEEKPEASGAPPAVLFKKRKGKK